MTDSDFDIDVNDLMWDMFFQECSKYKLRNVGLRLTEPGDGYYPDDVRITETPAKGSRRFREVCFLLSQLTDILIDDVKYEKEEHWLYYNVLSAVVFREERIKFTNIVPLIVKKNQTTKHTVSALRRQRKEEILLGFTLKCGRKTLPAKLNCRGRMWTRNMWLAGASQTQRENRRVCLAGAKQVEFTREVDAEYARIKADPMPSAGEQAVWDLVQDPKQRMAARLMIRRGVQASFWARVYRLSIYNPKIIKAEAGLPLACDFMQEKKYLVVAEDPVLPGQEHQQHAFGAVSWDDTENKGLCLRVSEVDDVTSALSCDTYMAIDQAGLEELCPPEPEMTAFQLKRYIKKWDELWERRQSNLAKIKKRLAKEQAKTRARQARPIFSVAKKRVLAKKQ